MSIFSQFIWVEDTWGTRRLNSYPSYEQYRFCCTSLTQIKKKFADASVLVLRVIVKLGHPALNVS